MILENIHEDFRGALFNLTKGFKYNEEVLILKTNAGYARGGCIHYKSWEHLVVIEGEICYHFKLPNESKEKDINLFPGQNISIPPNTSHYYISITDSIVMEWGATKVEKQARDEEMRRMIEEHNKTV